jgi:UDPglucose--hexose-1-phosphate uridylyltransferase
MPEFRKDPVTGRWVIISTERAQRPQHYALGDNSIANRPCPFCAGNEALTPPQVLIYRDDQRHGGDSEWIVRVVPNKYPALVSQGRELENSDGFYQSRVGLGVHEVIIESPDHIENMALLTQKQLEAVLLSYRDRMLELRADGRWRHILIYKNQGAEAGATLPHVHSQLIALPHVPKEVAAEIDGARGFYDATGHCIYCEMIRKETSEGKRMVAEHERFVVFCAYAPRFPFEVWIVPRGHRSCFEMDSKECYLDLACALRETLIRINRQLDSLSFNYILHSNPVGQGGDEFYHWHMEVLPRLIQVAGFEWGSGSFINTVAPEDAARLLREVTL